MKLHPKIKMICEEFAESYEWVEGDDSLFIRVASNFIDIIKKHLETCKLEYVDTQNIGQICILWYRLPEENEPAYDFIQDEDEDE